MKRIRIHMGNISRLKAVLDRYGSDDPYATSLAHLALTGRNGLWLIEEAGSHAVMCMHPNNANQMMVFPPFGRNAAALLRKVFARWPHVRLARVPTDRAVFLSAAHPEAAVPIQEDVLDWKYPVHTLDTNKVAALEGRKLQKVRAKVRRANRNGVEVNPLTLNDYHEAVALAARWTACQHQRLEGLELVAPYAYVFALLADPDINVRGHALRQNGRLVGLDAWEEPQNGSGIACGVGSLTVRDIPGIAEFQIHASCSALASCGIERLCIGGSETEGLDKFKKKFLPAQSIELCSIEAAAKGRIQKAA